MALINRKRPGREQLKSFSVRLEVPAFATALLVVWLWFRWLEERRPVWLVRSGLAQACQSLLFPGTDVERADLHGCRESVPSVVGICRVAAQALPKGFAAAAEAEYSGGKTCVESCQTSCP